jgi:hypothetical protein
MEDGSRTGTVTWSRGRRWILSDGDGQLYVARQEDAYTPLLIRRRVRFEVRPGEYGPYRTAVDVRRLE